MNQVATSPSLWGIQHQQQQQQRPRPRRGTTMATACDQCHRCKVRCSGGRPACERCQNYGSTCTYSLGKPLGKPPKSGRRKPPQPQPSAARTEEASGHVTEGHRVGTGDAHFGSSMELEHEITSKSPLLASFGNVDQYLSHDSNHDLFSASENNLNFFDGAGNAEEMNLDFLVDDFCKDSWTNTKNKTTLSSTPLPLEVPVTDNVRLVSPLPSLPSMTPPRDQEPADTQTQKLSQPSTENTICALEAIASTANDTSGDDNNNVNDIRHHLSILLEMTLRLHLKTPSITQPPISEALGLARQGLQAVQECLPHASSELSSHDRSSPRLGSGATELEGSTILACVLLMDKVILFYESLLRRCSGLGSSLDVSSPAPSPANSTSNPTTSGSSSHHRMQPIFIGDFEVQGKTSWKVILDAVVRAEKQEARNTVSRLEKWAKDLVGRGKYEGHLAVTYLEPLRQRSHDE